MADTVRFTEVMKKAGKPELYLPLSDPRRDRNFMRAVREERVLSLKQEPAGTRKDFGTVGFLAEKYVSYLMFPKPLTEFKERRVVGIKYDSLQQASVSTSPAVAAPKRSVRPATPKPKPRPRPKRFTATVRRIATNKLKVTVKAFDEKEARAKAEAVARTGKALPPGKVETELLKVVEDTPS